MLVKIVAGNWDAEHHTFMLIVLDHDGRYRPCIPGLNNDGTFSLSADDHSMLFAGADKSQVEDMLRGLPTAEQWIDNNFFEGRTR